MTVFAVILIHVVLMFGEETTTWYIRIRDFAFPVIVLSSFYLLTQSVWKRKTSFRRGVRLRIERLLVPAVIWSLIYWIGWNPMVALLTDRPLTAPPMPTLQLLVGGFMHLWYLMFLCYGSIAILGLMRAAQRVGQERWLGHAWLWLLVAIVYQVWVRDPLLNVVAPMGELGSPSWFVFKRQSLILVSYIPVGVALGLLAGRITRAGQARIVRYGAAAVAVVLAGLHTVGVDWQYARDCFSLAVFLAFLMPWNVRGIQWWAPPASESYAIYILHYGVAQVLVFVAQRFEVEARLITIGATSIAVYVACFLMARAARRVPMFNWLLPRVPVEGALDQTRSRLA